MYGLLDSLVIVGLFALRLAVPVVITLGIAWGLRRLDARWEAKAQTAKQPEQVVQLTEKPVPCWKEKGCSKEAMASCPACKWHDLPCWLARLRVENHLPAECINCHRFRPAPQVVTI